MNRISPKSRTLLYLLIFFIPNIPLETLKLHRLWYYYIYIYMRLIPWVRDNILPETSSRQMSHSSSEKWTQTSKKQRFPNNGSSWTHQSHYIYVFIKTESVDELDYYDSTQPSRFQGNERCILLVCDTYYLATRMPIADVMYSPCTYSVDTTRRPFCPRRLLLLDN